MGKPYIYTRLFKQISIYDYRYWEKLDKNLHKLEFIMDNNPPDETHFSEFLWHWPLNAKPQKDLYNIIKLISRVTRVKLMWKWGMGYNETRDRQSLLIVGEYTRVIICNHVLNYTIEGILRFEDYLKKTERAKSKALNYKTITTYINWKISRELVKIFNSMGPTLFTTNGVVQNNRLENYIMGRYKLDYKNYGQLTNTYDNAVSQYFHPKRMML